MARRSILGAIVSVLVCLGAGPAAGAEPATSLLLPQSTAFSILGASCGGIQEQAFATGFDATSGYPTGDVYLQTRCGGSGRGGGYKTHTYSAWVGVTWDFAAAVHSYSKLAGAPEGLSPTFSAEDARGDQVYNALSAVNVQPANCTVGNTTYCTYRAYLKVVPPATPPAAPTGISAVQAGEQFNVEWTPDPAAAAWITSSTVTATPVGSAAPVLTATVSGAGTSGMVGPLQPATTYQVTVANTDAGGTSPASTPIEATSASPEPPPKPAYMTCEQNEGTIKLSPGLEETPHVQSITVKGELKGCDGATDVTQGKYVAHMKTTEEVTCSALTSFFAEPTTAPVSLSVKWTPSGSSHGTLSMPLTESSSASLVGTLEGGPFETPMSITAGTVSEAFTAGPSCGVPPAGKTKAKPVKSGTFYGSTVEIGG